MDGAKLFAQSFLHAGISSWVVVFAVFSLARVGIVDFLIFGEQF